MLVHGRYEQLSATQMEHMRTLEEHYSAQPELPTDPHAPCFYHVYENTLPREFHYRIIPEGKHFTLLLFEEMKSRHFGQKSTHSSFIIHVIFRTL